jgi:hypothetical protein
MVMMMNKKQSISSGSALSMKTGRHCFQKNKVMFKMLQGHIALFVLALIGWCSQAVGGAPVWGRALSPQEIADVNALLPEFTVAGAGLWNVARANSLVPGQTVQEHYEERHGAHGIHTRTCPVFNGAAVASPEVAVANVIAAILAAPGIPPAGALANTNPDGTREIRMPIPSGQAQIRKGRGAARNASF